MKKINETLSDLKDHLNDFNNKGNLYAISDKLMQIMDNKLKEAEYKNNIEESPLTDINSEGEDENDSSHDSRSDNNTFG